MTSGGRLNEGLAGGGAIDGVNRHTACGEHLATWAYWGDETRRATDISRRWRAAARGIHCGRGVWNRAALVGCAHRDQYSYECGRDLLNMVGIYRLFDIKHCHVVVARGRWTWHLLRAKAMSERIWASVNVFIGAIDTHTGAAGFLVA
jgi:hypothetical protein